MSQSHSVTHWIEQLKAGEGSDAQQQLWNRYFRRLVRLADKQLGDTPRRVADQEDVALNALPNDARFGKVYNSRHGSSSTLARGR